MIKIKICGITCEGDTELLNRFKTDYAGFVFAESRRRVSAKTAENLSGRLDADIIRVGVFVNANPDKIARLYSDGVIQLAQLHGTEDAEYVKSLKKLCGVAVIKAVGVSVPPLTDEFGSLGEVDYLLFDKADKDGGVRGGTGEVFNWKNIPETPLPYFLAGGINSSNIKAALEFKPAPYALDISGGVESDDKTAKDEKKLEALFSVYKIFAGADFITQ